MGGGGGGGGGGRSPGWVSGGAIATTRRTQHNRVQILRSRARDVLRLGAGARVALRRRRDWGLRWLQCWPCWLAREEGRALRPWVHRQGGRGATDCGFFPVYGVLLLCNFIRLYLTLSLCTTLSLRVWGCMCALSVCLSVCVAVHHVSSVLKWTESVSRCGTRWSDERQSKQGIASCQEESNGKTRDASVCTCKCAVRRPAAVVPRLR